MIPKFLNPLQDIKSRLEHWMGQSPSTRDPGLFIYMWKTYGFLKAVGIGHYDDRFFEEQLRLEGAYADLASVINWVLQPKSACDFGCGNGFIINYLKQLGVTVRGVETSTKAYQFVPPQVREHILTEDILGPLPLGKFDVTISTEVAEHIPKAKGELLVRNLTHHASRGIFFTAARPGQWGDGHINCQPKSYWEHLFLTYGWSRSEVLQDRFLAELCARPCIDEHLPWASKNAMIFVPVYPRGRRVSAELKRDSYDAE